MNVCGENDSLLSFYSHFFFFAAGFLYQWVWKFPGDICVVKWFKWLNPCRMYMARSVMTWNDVDLVDVQSRESGIPVRRSLLEMMNVAPWAISWSTSSRRYCKLYRVCVDMIKIHSLSLSLFVTLLLISFFSWVRHSLSVCNSFCKPINCLQRKC